MADFDTNLGRKISFYVGFPFDRDPLIRLFAELDQVTAGVAGLRHDDTENQQKPLEVAARGILTE